MDGDIDLFPDGRCGRDIVDGVLVEIRLVLE